MPPRKKTSTEVAVQEKPAVPELARTPSLGLTADDVQLPRLYIAQSNTRAFQEQLVPLGAIFLATDPEDPDPQMLYNPKEGGDGILFHPLHLIKGWSYSHKEHTGGELQRWAFDDPDRHPDAWITYTYFVCLPEVDEELPARLLLTRTSIPTAKRINAVLGRHEDKGPIYELAFRLKSVPRENAKGRWHIAQARQVEAKAEHVEIAEQMFSLVSGVDHDRFERSNDDEPEI